MRTIPRASFIAAWLIAASLALACHAAAQEPPGPKLPAMPSMDQKGSDDLTKPAGAEKKLAPAPAAPKPSKSDEPKAKLVPAAKPAVAKPAAAKPPAAKPVATKPAAAKHGLSPKQHVSKPLVARTGAPNKTHQTGKPPATKRPSRKDR